MSDTTKKGAGWFSKLMDRRAAKGGKLVTWWRNKFGRLSTAELEQLADEVTPLAKKASDRLKK